MEKSYWFVDMGRLNHLNGPCSYPFPTPEAAQRFAANHQALAPHRVITVRPPSKGEEA